MGTHVNIADEVMSHFVANGSLPEGVGRMKTEHVEELIDAIPDSEQVLIGELREILRREGVC